MQFDILSTSVSYLIYYRFCIILYSIVFEFFISEKMKRNYPSGAQKRKLVEEKQQRNSEDCSKISKLTSFFKPVSSEATTSAATSQTDGVSNIELFPSSATNIISEQFDVSEPAIDVSLPRCSQDIVQEFVQEMEHSCSPNNNRSKDPGLWTDLNAADVAYWLDHGPVDCQNKSGLFEKSCRTYPKGKGVKSRYCSKSYFLGVKPNGEKYPRDWLLYSPAIGSVYCFVCKLFPNKSAPTRFGTDGFCDWKNSVLIEQHEHCPTHQDSQLTYLCRRQGLGLTHQLEEQIKRERDYWQHLLQRIAAVIRTLAERGLAFRGSDDKFGSLHNGNYMGLLELVSEFDSFLASHISKYGNGGKGSVSYLSKTICDEVIKIMSDKVHTTIMDEIRSAGYFSLSIDSTPDLSHVDQLSIILRYVSPVDGKPVERFATFLTLESHTGEQMSIKVLNYLCEKCKLDFSKCRGQSYDNAANMSGCYQGMQQKILEENKFAVFIPCAGHSLNLVGRSAVDSCPIAVNFYLTVQQLYNFFSISTHRWGVLKEKIGHEEVLKSLSKTRWEAHAKSTSAIMKSYRNIVEALDCIAEDQTQKGETRREAENLANKMEELEFVFMLTMWDEILKHFHHTSKSIQAQELNLKVCGDLYQSLGDHLRNLRNEFERFEGIAKGILPTTDYKRSLSRKQIRKKQPNDGSAEEVEFNARDHFRFTTYYPIIDTLQTQLQRRAEVYRNVGNKFSFLSDLNLSADQYSQYSQKLVAEYPEDLDMNLCGELKQFHCYVRAKFPDGEKKLSLAELQQILVNDEIQNAFLNVEIALRIFLTLMITNCTAERSFSQLKRIKNHLRTTLGQDKLESLSLLCIEADILRKISFHEVLKEFAMVKTRKKMF